MVMGTNATIRLTDNIDYIEAYTQHDGTIDKFKQTTESLISEWESSLSYFREKIAKAPQGVLGMEEWANSLEKLIIDFKENPTIDKMMALICSKSLHHYTPFPVLTNGSYLNFLNENNPNFVFNIKSKEINVRNYNEKVTNFDIKPKKIDEIYKILRIKIGDENGNIKEAAYLDLKYKDISEEELFQHITQLPMFWRDFYYTCKTKNDRDYSNKKNNVEYITRQLNSYYVPKKEYSFLLFEYFEMGEDYDSRMKRASRAASEIENQSLSMDVLAVHLMTSLPGKILPLTNSERLDHYDISFNICICGEKMKMVFCEIPSFSDEQISELHNKVIDLMMAKEVRFLFLNKVDSIFKDIYQYSLNGSPRYLGGDYQVGIIKLMETQTMIEINESKEP